MQKVSFITVNYNGLSDTLELIQSIIKNSYSNVEIIVVDNQSKENPKPVIMRQFPNVKVVVSEENVGFAGGNNLGISLATGEFLFFINNDTIITDGCIETLIATFENHSKVGGISPMITYYDKPDYIQFAGFTPINHITGRNATIGEMEKNLGQYSRIQNIPYLHGAAMFISRKVVNDVGLMPDFFFLYYEELDWSLRIREKGYELLFQPMAKILHKESVSVGKDSPTKVYYMTRNRIWFMKRNFPRTKYLIFLLFYTFLALPKNLLGYLIKGESGNFRIAFNAYLSGMRNFSKTSTI